MAEEKQLVKVVADTPEPRAPTTRTNATAFTTLSHESIATECEKVIEKVGKVQDDGLKQHEVIKKALVSHQRQLIGLLFSVGVVAGFVVFFFWRVEPFIQSRQVKSTSPTLPSMTKVSKSERRLLEDNVTLAQEFTMSKSEYDATLALYLDGVEGFIHRDEFGASHIDITGYRRIDDDASNPTDHELSVQRSFGNTNFEVLVSCDADDDKDGESECRFVVPDLHSDDAGRRLQEEGGYFVNVEARRLRYGVTNNYHVTQNNYFCFPAGTMVQTVGGAAIPIQDVQIGMQLLGSQGATPVMLHGHFDADASTTMVHIETASEHSVAASPDHYFPLANGQHKAARHLQVGDELIVQTTGGLEKSKIISLSPIEQVGLYNPYTATGDILVNGILATNHAGWFLEETSLSESSIVAVYNAVFKPINWLYAVKPESFQCFHKMIVQEWPAYDLAKIPISFLFSSGMKSIFVGCSDMPEQAKISVSDMKEHAKVSHLSSLPLLA